MKTKPLVVKLPEELKKQLKILAARQGTGMTTIVKNLIMQYVAGSDKPTK